jgi:hypothetical protein
MKSDNMKKQFLLALLAILFCIKGGAQAYMSQASLEDFFQNSNAVKGLATCAHPTSTYTEGSYSVTGTRITITVYFSDNSYTVITATYERNGDYFSSVGYTTDTDGFPPFLAIGLIKDFIVEYFKQSGELSCLERFFRQSVNDMTGAQLTRTFLTDAWWKWNGKRCE